MKKVILLIVLAILCICIVQVGMSTNNGKLQPNIIVLNNYTLEYSENETFRSVIKELISKYPQFNNNQRIIEEWAILSVFLERKEWETAIAIIDKLREKYPEAPDGRRGLWVYQLGHCYERLGNTARALHYYDEFIKNYPSHKYILNALSRRILLDSEAENRREALLIASRKLLKEHPDNPNIALAQLYIANVYFRDNDCDNALLYYRAIIGSDDVKDYKILGDAHYGLARCEDRTVLSLGQSQDIPKSAWNSYLKAAGYYQQYLISNGPGVGLAPMYLFRIWQIYNHIGLDDKANKLSEQLRREHPDSIYAQRMLTLQDYRERMRGEIITDTASLEYEIGLKIDWEAEPIYEEMDIETISSIRKVKVAFSVHTAFARWQITPANKGEIDYDLDWEKGPGPYYITVDTETGLPSTNQITAKATISFNDISGKLIQRSDTATFSYQSYIQMLIDQP